MNSTVLIVVLLSFLFIVAQGAWNGFVIRWNQAHGDDKKHLSQIWHAIGFVIRAMPLVPLAWYFWADWPYELILCAMLYFNFSWTVYDAVIALIFKKPIWYTGSTSTIDKLGAKIGWILKGALFLATIGYIIYYYATYPQIV